jgi:single-stranded-DNA-specific exonuclease
MYGDGLELAAIGTIADVIPLLGANRSIVKYGLTELNQTKRPGLLAMFAESAITKGEIGTYQVGWLISPV